MRRRYNYLLPAYLNCFVWLTYVGCLLLGGKQTDISGWVPLAVGLISVSGVLLTALFQLKRGLLWYIELVTPVSNSI